MEKKLSLVMPAFNEEENIEEAIVNAFNVLSTLALDDYEVHVVDDGSTDGTKGILQRLSGIYPKLRYTSFQANRGYGVALREGFAAAEGNIIFYTDSDNQFDLREIKNFLPAIEDYDAVVGFRIYRFDPPARLFLSWGYNVLVRLLFGIRIRDVDCAFKMFRKEIFNKIIIRSDDFFVDTEIVAEIRYYKFKMTEIGVRHYPRKAGRSTIRASHILSTLKELGKIWFQIRFRKQDAAAQH